MHRLILAIAFGLILTPGPAGAQWFGLELGSERHYVLFYNGGGTEVNRFTTMDLVRGREVFRMEAVQEFAGQAPHVYWNYWSLDEQGRLLLHGFKAGAEPDAYGVAYEPPLIAGHPEIDATWSATVDALNFQSGEFIGTRTFNGTNYGVEQLPLNIGTFDAMIIGMTPVPPDPPNAATGTTENRYSLTGRIVPTGARRSIVEASVSWWVEGIGEVQYANGSSTNIYSTITFASVPIDEDLSSASRLKARFLNQD